MLSIQECRKILCEKGLILTDEQIKLIRDFLYSFGELDYQIQKKKRNENSNNLHQSIN